MINWGYMIFGDEAALIRARISSYRGIVDDDATTILAIYIGRRTTTTNQRN